VIKHRNWWVAGHSAAMRATCPADFIIAIKAAGESCDVKAFIAGWHSAWRCERGHEDGEALNVQMGRAG
jgi:hypothetical protein